jgi:hypothetical protein
MGTVRYLFTLLIFQAATLIFQTSSSNCTDLIVSGTTQITTPSTYDSVVVLNGGTLTADAAISVLGNMRIEPGGVVTHSVRQLGGLILDIAGNLQILRSGSLVGRIDVTGCGLLGANRNSPAGCGNRGETYDSLGNIVCGSSGSSGGSFGGVGGTGAMSGVVADAYDLVESVVHVGGGGGGNLGYPHSPAAGNGGGSVHIQADTVFLDGEIRADGGSAAYAGSCTAYSDVGGGSGGGIQIEANVFRGNSSGVISADGGRGSCNAGGAGGGGRIVLLSDDHSSYFGAIEAIGGFTTQQISIGSPGTIFIRGARTNASVLGTLIVRNSNRVSSYFTPIKTDLTQFKSVEVLEGSKVNQSGRNAPSITVAESVLVDGSAVYQLIDSSVLTIAHTGVDLALHGQSSFRIYRGSQLHAAEIHVDNASLYTESALTFASAADLRMSGVSGLIQVRDSAVISIPAFDETNIQSGTFDLGSDASLWIGADSVRVGSGVTLIKDGRFGDGGGSTTDHIGAATVLAGGRITHSARLLSGLALNVSRLWIQRTGSSFGRIDVTGCGLLGGNSNSPAGCGNRGETYDSLGNIVCGSAGSSGGSHGGLGGTGGMAGEVAGAYDLVESVTHLGGGGGGNLGYPHSPAAGNGGGLIRIQADTVIVDGEIRADGETPYVSNCIAYSDVGGGAGGGIQIEAEELRGSPGGVVAANGGGGPCGGSGAGGGGRIVLLADHQSDYQGILEACGGYTNEQRNIGSPGTIFRRNSWNDINLAGDMLLTNGGRISSYYTPLLTKLNELRSVQLSSGATFNHSGKQKPALTVHEGVTIDSSIYQLSDSATLAVDGTAADIEVERHGALQIYPGGVISLDHIVLNQGTLYTEENLSFGAADGLIVSGSSSQVLLRDSSVLHLPSMDETNVQSGTVEIGSGSSLWIDSDSIRIGSGVILIKDGRFGNDESTSPDKVGNLTILPGGTISHSSRYLPGLSLNVTGRLWIQRSEEATGRIDVTGCGLLGANRNSPVGCGNRGETYDSLGNIVCGSSGSSGGSYGGVGGTGVMQGVVADEYGLIESATHLGGGGGGNLGYPYSPAAGNGGGLVRIQADTVIVDGEIKADGGSVTVSNCLMAYSEVGGGSGGGVQIEANWLGGSSTGGITANGGNGPCGKGGGGGGGRIVVMVDDYSSFEGRYFATGGYAGENRNIAAAGSIYLRSSRADTLPGTLIADNGGKLSPYHTTVATKLSRIDTLSIKNSAIVQLNSQLEWNAIVLDSASLVASDSLLVTQGSMLMGSGVVAAPKVVNSGVVAPGLRAPGCLAIQGNFVQTFNGEMKARINGATKGTSYDYLKVNGLTTLNGTLSVQIADGYQPEGGTKFWLLDCSFLSGTFSGLSGIDTASFGLTYTRTSALLTAGSNLVQRSTCDNRIIISPAGTLSFNVSLRDAGNSPLVNSRDVWLDFSEAVGLVPCASEALWPEVGPLEPSNSEGRVTFRVRAGGCTQDSVKVMSSHGLIAKVPIRSMDASGGLLVDAKDFTDGPCSDYNIDGVVDNEDFALFTAFLGQSCLESATNYLKVSLSTDPPAGSIFEGDTVHVCTTIENTLEQDIAIDSILFSSSSLGIGQQFLRFGLVNGAVAPALGSITVCRDFIYPSGHICFRTGVFPRQFASAGNASRVVEDKAEVNSGEPTGVDLLNRRISQFRVGGASMFQAVQLLRYRYGLPINLIHSGGGRSLYYSTASATLGEVLHSLCCQDNGYTYEYVRGRLFVFPKELTDRGSQVPLKGALGPRKEAAKALIRAFASSGLSDSEVISNDEVQSAPVSIGESQIQSNPMGTVLDHVRDLLSDDDSVVVTWDLKQSNEVPVQFATIGTPNQASLYQQNPNSCADCRATHVIIGEPEIKNDIGDVERALNKRLCPTDQTSPYITCYGYVYYPYTGVRVDCCPGEPCDCNGAWISEVNVPYFASGTDSRCSGAPENGPAWQIGPGNVISHDGDFYGGCVNQNTDLAGVGEPWECTIVWNQLLLLCGQRVIEDVLVTTKISFDGHSCPSIEKPSVSRSLPSPYPPRDCNCVCGQPGCSGCGIDRQVNRDARPKPPGSTRQRVSSGAVVGSLSKTPGEETETEHFRIPVSNYLADSLRIFTFPFLPAGWTYEISDSGWIRTPDTIEIDITPSTRLVLGDTGRVSIYAYDNLNQPAGNAEALVFASQGAVDVHEPGSNDLPKTFDLSQNYPNPFNPTTVIKFSLPRRCSANLEIYNILGQRVAVLVDKELAAGYYELQWNGTNSSGGQVGSGVYFYHLRAGDFVSSKKMVLLR